jgi:L-ribulose-5-phosphate 3-epimerase
MTMSRRTFIKQSAVLTGAVAAGGLTACCSKQPLFKISLAQWSLNRALFAGERDALDFARDAKEEFGIEAIEYVNQFFFDKAKDPAYIGELKKRAQDYGVRSVLIMCDNEGRLGDPDEKARLQAVENHYKWVEAAKTLGCHSIRVNAASEGSYEEQQKLAIDGLHRLTEFSAKVELNTIVENHGGLSSNGQWLSEVIKAVDHPRCGTLPDFGNFRISREEEYDRYLGVQQLMPYAKGVSAKSGRFDEQGNETSTDFYKMMRIVLDAGYNGYVGIESGGNQMSEPEAILATKRLLERVRERFTAEQG